MNDAPQRLTRRGFPLRGKGIKVLEFLKDGPRTMIELGELVGTGSDKMSGYLRVLLGQQHITKEGSYYYLAPPPDRAKNGDLAPSPLEPSPPIDYENPDTMGFLLQRNLLYTPPCRMSFGARMIARCSPSPGARGPYARRAR